MGYFKEKSEEKFNALLDLANHLQEQFENQESVYESALFELENNSTQVEVEEDDSWLNIE